MSDPQLYDPLNENRYLAVLRVLSDVYNWLIPLVTINILWFVLSLTVILMPPATAALYDTAYRALRGEGPQVREYLGAVRRWLLPAWIWGALTVFFLALTLVALSFYGEMVGGLGAALYFLAAGIALFFMLTQFYFWPYMLLMEKPSIRLALRNAALTVLGDPLYTLWNAAISALLLAVGVILVMPVAVIVPVFIAFLGTYGLRAWLYFRGLLPAQQTADQPEESPD
jgi:hypothetical protein